MTCYGFELDSPNLHQICILGFSQLVLKIGVIDLDLQRSFGHFNSEFQETALNVALLYWSRPANGCYTSQTYSCYSDVAPVPRIVRCRYNMGQYNTEQSTAITEVDHKSYLKLIKTPHISPSRASFMYEESIGSILKEIGGVIIIPQSTYLTGAINNIVCGFLLPVIYCYLDVN